MKHQVAWEKWRYLLLTSSEWVLFPLLELLADFASMINGDGCKLDLSTPTRALVDSLLLA